MCLYPRLIKNRKYTETKKNGGNIPKVKYYKTLKVPVACGKCIECRKAKAREWQVRLHEEIKGDLKPYFVTLTFSNESLQELIKETKTECNATATLAVRRFLERWRKKYKKSLRHWLITELGHNGTERIHLHGIILTNEKKEDIVKIWGYGFVYIGDYCNARTINYIVKYVTKLDHDHKGYEPAILCSAGIGKHYLDTMQAQLNRYRPKGTNEFYRLPNGAKIALPIYYRNKIYSEDERELLWIEKIKQERRYITGTRYDTKTPQQMQTFLDALKEAQTDNIKMGYGDLSAEWKEKQYNVTWKMLQRDTQE